MALAILIAPKSLKAILAHFVTSDRFYFVAFLRVVFGVLFLLAADGSRWPVFVKVMGVFFIFAGVVMPIIGGLQLKLLAEWWMRRNNSIIRVWAIIAVVLGALIVYAGGSAPS
jgi:hypothetical protein